MVYLKKYKSEFLVVASGIMILAIIVGCSEVDSSDLKSSGFYASMHVTANGNNQTEVWVSLKTGPRIDADSIDLSEGDTLTATANGITKTLSRDISYETSFNFDEGGAEFVISLERNEGEDMPSSRVELPQKFAILMPNVDEILNSGETITVTWSPSVESETIEVSYRGDCISKDSGSEIHFGRGYIINDVGTHTVSVDDILNVFGEHEEFNKNITCPSSISIERVNTGTIDPNYGKGGVITAKQIRSISIGINP